MTSRKRKPLYSAYILNDYMKSFLMEYFEPKYEKVVAHHITVRFGDIDENDIPPDAELEVVGYTDSEDGLQALVVSVNGNITRPDGKTFHITWSLENGYKPVDSNKIIDSIGFDYLTRSIPIVAKPTIVYSKN